MRAWGGFYGPNRWIWICIGIGNMTSWLMSKNKLRHLYLKNDQLHGPREHMLNRFPLHPNAGEFHLLEQGPSHRQLFPRDPRTGTLANGDRSSSKRGRIGRIVREWPRYSMVRDLQKTRTVDSTINWRAH